MASNNKTEFLFESDAEKAVLNKASKELKKKSKKHIFLKAFLISFAFLLMFIPFTYFKEKKLSNLGANAHLIKEKDPSEKKAFNVALKKYIVNYNDKYTILVNDNNPINKSIINKYNLIKINDEKYNNIFLETETYANYLKLKEALSNKGYTTYIKCGFISSDTNLGTSEHNTGLAFDIEVDKSSKEVYEYIEKISYIYGFIIRYPKNKEKVTGYKYDPTHIRYVGHNLAKYLKKNNMTLEEYYNVGN